MFFTSYLHNVKCLTTYNAYTSPLSIPQCPACTCRSSLLLALHKWTCTVCDFSAVLTTECMLISLWAYLWCSNPIVNDMKDCGLTALPTWNLTGPKSPHSYLLNIKYVHIHCDIITLHSILLSVRSAKKVVLLSWTVDLFAFILDVL